MTALTRPSSRPRKLRTANFAVCPLCEKLVELLEFTSAATIFHTDLQDIEFLTNAGSVHRVHNRKGAVMVCSNSLFNCFDNRRTRLLDSHFAEPANEEKLPNGSDDGSGTGEAAR